MSCGGAADFQDVDMVGFRTRGPLRSCEGRKFCTNTSLMMAPSRSTPALVAFGRVCSVTGNEPKAGRFNSALSDASLAGNPREVRAVMPNPPMAEAHNPAKLGLTAAMRHGMLASSSFSIAFLRKAHWG